MRRNAQKKKEWVKVANHPHCNLYRSTMNPTVWQIRYRASGGYLRRRINASTAEQAMEHANAAGVDARQPERKPRIRLVDAFNAALGITSRRELSRKDWIKSVEKFLRWLQKHHPLVTHWHLLSRAIVREYLSTFDGKSPNHRRLSMQPITQTAGFMHREYEFPAIGARLGIGSKLKTPPKSVYLEDVISFCDFMKEGKSHLEVGACLQGLAGLQLMEALRLTWRNVDFENGLIEITGEVKNEYRNRVIPVCARVLDALKRCKQSRSSSRSTRVLSVDENVVLSKQGYRFELAGSYSRKIKAALKKWNARCDWAAKDLRNCLPTFSKMEGLHGTIWEQYIGHAPRTVTDRHYVPRLAARTNGEHHALMKQMKLFRTLVTDHVDAFKPDAEICNFLQLSENGGVPAGDEKKLSA